MPLKGIPLKTLAPIQFEGGHGKAAKNNTVTTQEETGCGVEDGTGTPFNFYPEDILPGLVRFVKVARFSGKLFFAFRNNYNVDEPCEASIDPVS